MAKLTIIESNYNRAQAYDIPEELYKNNDLLFLGYYQKHKTFSNFELFENDVVCIHQSLIPDREDNIKGYLENKLVIIFGGGIPVNIIKKNNYLVSDSFFYYLVQKSLEENVCISVIIENLLKNKEVFLEKEYAYYNKEKDYIETLLNKESSDKILYIEGPLIEVDITNPNVELRTISREKLNIDDLTENLADIIKDKSYDKFVIWSNLSEHFVDQKIGEAIINILMEKYNIPVSKIHLLSNSKEAI
jgi:hypothetical protein